MTTNTIHRPPVTIPDPPSARFARYREVYAAVRAARGWPPDPWLL